MRRFNILTSRLKVNWGKAILTCLWTFVNWSKLFSKKAIFCFCAWLPPSSSVSVSALVWGGERPQRVSHPNNVLQIHVFSHVRSMMGDILQMSKAHVTWHDMTWHDTTRNETARHDIAYKYHHMHVPWHRKTKGKNWRCVLWIKMKIQVR